jgi:hypothetical protein
VSKICSESVLTCPESVPKVPQSYPEGVANVSNTCRIGASGPSARARRCSRREGHRSQNNDVEAIALCTHAAGGGQLRVSGQVGYPSTTTADRSKKFIMHQVVRTLPGMTDSPYVLSHLNCCESPERCLGSMIRLLACACLSEQ